MNYVIRPDLFFGLYSVILDDTVLKKLQSCSYRKICILFFISMITYTYIYIYMDVDM